MTSRSLNTGLQSSRSFLRSAVKSPIFLMASNDAKPTALRSTAGAWSDQVWWTRYVRLLSVWD